MARFGRFNAQEMEKFQKGLAKIKREQLEDFLNSCVKELAARLLAKVIPITPVADYSKEIEVTAKRDSKKHKKGETYKKRVNPSGKVGGTLKRGWGAKGASGAAGYVDSLSIVNTGGVYTITIINPVEYASYVEFGHRTRGHKGWVKGRFMLTISEQQIESAAPAILERKLKKFLEGCMAE